MRVHNLAGSIFHEDFEPVLLILFMYCLIYFSVYALFIALFIDSCIKLDIS